jgi:pilus assembly protein CpaB
MNGRSGLMMVVAIVFGLGAMYGANRLMGRGAKANQTREVLTAARDLKVEEVLKPELVQVIKLPVESVPPGSFASYKDVADRWVRMPLLAGEPILDGKLAPKDAPVGLLARIPRGMRAFAIEVNEQSGVSGFVLPDHHVDVILARTTRATTGGRHEESETILQNVPVLAAGQVTTRPEDKSIQVRTVTLAVTPAQVDALVAAKTQGTLSLSLRGNNDAEIVARPEPPPEPEPEPTPDPGPPEPPPPPVIAAAPVAVAPPPAPSRRSVLIFHGPRRVERIRVGPAHADPTPLDLANRAGDHARPDEDEHEDAENPQSRPPDESIRGLASAPGS